MLKIHRPFCPDLALRLAHDISPENYPEDVEDYDSELRKEQFILSCLTQKQASCDNLTDCIKDKGHEKGKIMSPNEIKQKTLEHLNNVINSQYHTKSETKNQLNEKGNCTTTDSHVEELQANGKPDRPCCFQNGLKSKSNGYKLPRRHRKLPEIPTIKNQNSGHSPNLHGQQNVNEKCLADELQEALVRSDYSEYDESDDVFLPNNTQHTTATPNKVYPKYSGKFMDELKTINFNSVSKNTKPLLTSDNIYLSEDSVPDNRCPSGATGGIKQRLDSDECAADRSGHLLVASAGGRRGRDSDEDDIRRKSSSSFPGTNYLDLEVTHRGMHRFIPRHKDEIPVEIGDPIHVYKLSDDLWCEAVNLRTCQRGIFPSMYATDLQFLEDDTDEDGNSHFSMRFLGSVEVNGHKGDEVLCQAINKVAMSRRSAKCSIPPPLVSVEISQYGIRMLDKSKTGHESDEFTHFFALKNISFCGFHPRNERYFGYITKHPKTYRFACHVFLGEKSTRSVVDALGNAFKRFYQEYMAFTHPTEDIYME